MPGPYTFPTNITAGDSGEVAWANSVGAALNEAAAASTPDVLMLRDTNGRAQVADPSAAPDVATKGYVDTAAGSKAPLASPTFTGNPTAPTPATTDNDTSIATTAFVKAQGYAPLASPTFTGNPTAPTPATSDNDTSVATTAFVKAQGYAPLASPALTGNPTAPTPTAGDNDTSVATTAFVTTAVAATVPKSLVTAKGDLVGASGSGVPARVAVGTDGQVLTADSTQASGVKWAAAASGGAMLLYDWPTVSATFWASPVLTSGAGNSPVSTLSASSLWIPPTGTTMWSSANVQVTTAGAAGDTITVTFYSANADLSKSSTVLDTLTFAVSTVGRIEQVFTSPLTIPQYGMYAVVTGNVGTTARLNRANPTWGPGVTWAPGSGSGVASGPTPATILNVYLRVN